MDRSILWDQFKGEPEDTCYCRCGKVYRSYTKMINIISRGNLGTPNVQLVVVAQKPCPGCKKTDGHLRRVSGDKELLSV